MTKVTSKDFRREKEITLPASGVTLICYSSVLVGDIVNLDLNGEKKLEQNVEIILKVIKEWNFYDKDEDESPLPITMDNLKRIPAPDFTYLVEQIELFATEQKKS